MRHINYIQILQNTLKARKRWLLIIIRIQHSLICIIYYVKCILRYESYLNLINDNRGNSIPWAKLKMKSKNPLLLAIVALIAFEAGFFIGTSPKNGKDKEANYKNCALANISRDSGSVIPEPMPNIQGVGEGNGIKYAFTQKQLRQVLKATQEDIEMTQELQKREAAGEFILRNERPLMRKSQEWNFSAIASRTLTNNSVEYTELFSKFGVNEKDNQALQIHLGRIHRASLEAESANLQLLEAQYNFDQRVRNLLKDKYYAAYREFEEMKFARNEVNKIQHFFKDSQIAPLNSSSELALARIIKETDTNENELWHGPYSRVPIPVIGRDQAITSAQQELKNITDSTTQILLRLGGMEFTSEQKSGIENYLGDKMHVKNRELANLLSKKVISLGTNQIGIQNQPDSALQAK